MNRLGSAMWGSLALIAWTHAGYPAVAAAAASRSRYRPRTDDAHLPTVALVIAAHDEERVIGERLENALALDYPSLEIVVSLDGSTDRTREIVEGYGVTLIDNPRGGKVPAQNAAVRATSSDVVAFSDANSMWEPDALRRLVRHFADPEVGYVCGRLRLIEPGTGRNVEGQYWRYELWLRALESRLGSITAGNGAIYAVRHGDYLEFDPPMGHDLSFPFHMVRRGRRAVYVPAARATERMVPTIEGEWERKRRMMNRAWQIVLISGISDLRGYPPLYGLMIVSHRLLRYASPFLHVVALVTALALSRRRLYRAAAAAQLALLGAAAAGDRIHARPLLIARYYVLTTASIAAGLVDHLRRGTPAGWEQAEGTRV
jgi:cellulose synthase/poly-beta-1,6-N-acetylglucosamine synthase-like glycosyltransferase